MADVEMAARGALRPWDALRAGWAMVRGQYAGLVVLTTLALTAGSVVPFGLVMGPMMCGIHLCYLNRAAGRRADLDTLFRGFDSFLPSLVATLAMTVLYLMLLVPFGVFTLVLLWRVRHAGELEDPTFLFLMMQVWAVLLAFEILAAFNVAFFFTFAYLLIADKGLGGFQALAVSARAAWRHLGGLASLAVLVSAPAAGAMVGAFLIVWQTVSYRAALWSALAVGVPATLLSLPLFFGAVTAAYRSIFGTVQARQYTS